MEMMEKFHVGSLAVILWSETPWFKFVTLLLKAVKRGSVLKVDFCYDF